MDEYDKAFISNMAAWRVGPLQLRQLRVEPGKTKILYQCIQLLKQQF